jgi:hypothetical protein
MAAEGGEMSDFVNLTPYARIIDVPRCAGKSRGMSRAARTERDVVQPKLE